MQKTLDETTSIGTAVVIGAGTMGRGIAADIANAGWDVHLWDVSREVAEGAKSLLLANRPPLLFLDSFAERITPGALGENLSVLADADWVVEAVAESLEVKADVFDRIEPHIGPHTVVTSNTSGLSLNRMAAGRGERFRQRFFGTHFLNPPRYLKLLEVIPTQDTDPKTLAGFIRFAEGILGHRVVVARDTPGFISTRLWITHLMDSIHSTLEAGVGFDAVDALTGPLIGRPKSATFRMADVVGLDIIAAVAANQYAALPDDPLRERLRLPPLMAAMLERGWRGEKSGAGFYRRKGREILVLDPATMEYRPRDEPTGAETADLLSLSLPERLVALKAQQDTLAPRFVNALLDRLADYAEAVGPEIADDVLSLDRTMQWGFGWEIGPFALADCRADQTTNYAGEPPRCAFRAFPNLRLPWPDEPEYISLADRKSSGGLLETCKTASLVDIGAGVYCVEFHSKMNTLGPEICDFLLRAVDRATRDNRPLIIGNQGQHFCAGYDLTRLVAHMEAKDWTAIDREMSACQRAFHTLKYAPVPVVAAPHGFTLGGGAEIALHCAAIQAAPELAFGLPETLVGLIPCGGGTKEVLRRVLKWPSPDHQGFEPAEWFAAWWTLCIIARPETSANAHAAQVAGWLTSADRISRNPDRLLYDARELARHLFTDYAAPVPASILSLGPDGLNTTLRMSGILRWRGDDPTFTRYDARIADAVARLLSGDGTTGTLTEQEYFDLERRLFLELCREPLTLARTRHLLETGKHLRN